MTTALYQAGGNGNGNGNGNGGNGEGADPCAGKGSSGPDPYGGGTCALPASPENPDGHSDVGDCLLGDADCGALGLGDLKKTLKAGAGPLKLLNGDFSDFLNEHGSASTGLSRPLPGLPGLKFNLRASIGITQNPGVRGDAGASITCGLPDWTGCGKGKFGAGVGVGVDIPFEDMSEYECAWYKELLMTPSWDVPGLRGIKLAYRCSDPEQGYQPVFERPVPSLPEIYEGVKDVGGFVGGLLGF